MTVPTPPRLIRYFAVAGRWLLIVGVVFALTFTVGRYAVDQVAGKTYAATAVIQVVSSGPTDVSLETARKAVTSPKILSSVIDDLGLDRAWARRIFKSREDELSPADALAYMGKILEVEAKPGTPIMNITVSSDLPTEAAGIANAVADRYKISRDAEEFQQAARDSIPQALRDQIAVQQKLVEEKMAELQGIADNNSQEYLAAQADFVQQRNALDGLKMKARQSASGRPLTESPVRIVSRAEIPMASTDSYFGALLAVAIVLSVIAASFAEVLLLFSRAGERSGNY